MLKATVLSLLVGSAVGVGQVHEHIKNEACLTNYIQSSSPACVIPSVDGHGKCFPAGTAAVNNCKEITQWQWQHHGDKNMQYAPGVLPPAHRRQTHNGGDKKKVIWSYAAAITQALAVQIYSVDHAVSVEAVKKTPVNQISFIANVNVMKPTGWFKPGANNTEGCGQKQTVTLPFGYDDKDKDHSKFHSNLAELKALGVATTLTMGSWCTSFPTLTSEEWSDADFKSFVTYFEEVKSTTFGGNLDGIDFDWEGFCRSTCLREQCECAWDDKECGSLSPDQLAAGHGWNTTDWAGVVHKHECWIMPTKSTMQVVGGITHFMKAAGHLVTLVPMSTAMYTSEPDTSPNQVMRNEYVKWNKQTYEGQTFDMLEECDGALLQWYSGFDAGLCMNSDDPKACTCDNIQLDDYPNVYDNTNWGTNDTVAASYGYFANGRAGNMYPSKFPARCQACGPGNNTLKPDGTRGSFPCAPKDEMYVRASIGSGENSSNPKYAPLLAADKAGYDKFAAAHPNSLPFWWVQDVAVVSKCPRSIDCPDWRYEGEEPYARQLKLLQSVGKVIDLEKVSIGFETLGTDVLVQMQAWADPIVNWPDTTQKEHEQHIYYHACMNNQTAGDTSNKEPHNRCANPLMEQQWGLKFNASEILGLEAAVKAATGKDLAGVGTFTLDGMMWQPSDQPVRLWYPELCKLNKAYNLPQKCDLAPGPGPGPTGQCTGCASGTSGFCKTKVTNVCYPKVGGICPGGTFPCTTEGVAININ